MKDYFTFEKRGKIWTARIKEFNGFAFGRTKREAMAEYLRKARKDNHYQMKYFNEKLNNE